MHWEYKENEDSQVEHMIQTHKITREVAKLLLNRGIVDDLEVKEFLNPDLGNLHNPLIIKGLKKVINKIVEAKEKDKHIYIYGDYDVDGITASIYLTLALRKIGIKTDYYIPTRDDDGYGLTEGVVKRIKKKGGELIITVDTGLNSKEAFYYAQRLGIDIIVTDHHKSTKGCGDEVIVINPKLDENYPFKGLSGVGVAFKVACGLYIFLGKDLNELYEYLDIVMIGTVADVMPLRGENRVIVKKGLERLKETKLDSLVILLNYLKLSPQDISTTDISFFIAPLLNAVGRTGKSRLVADFLLEDSKKEIEKMIEKMKKSNDKRRELEKEIFEGIDLILKKDNLEEKKYLFLKSEEWHPGVIGVIASRLAIKYNIPVILISIEDGVGKASCRSVPGVNIFDILKESSHLFTRFGGHDLAAGFIADAKELDGIEELLGKKICKCEKVNENGKLVIDYRYSLDFVDEDFVKDLERVAPFGSANKYPIFTDTDIKLSRVKKFGAGGRHFKAYIEKNNRIYSAVGFNQGRKIADRIDVDTQFDIAYYPEKISYNGNKIIQIKIKDIKERIVNNKKKKC